MQMQMRRPLGLLPRRVLGARAAAVVMTVDAADVAAARRGFGTSASASANSVGSAPWLKRAMAASSAWKFVSGICELPHPQKRTTGGEDACFVDAQAVGVADGVGGWALKGVDAGEYSRKLMRSTRAAFQALRKKDSGRHPLEALIEAHRKVTCPGSSTACVVQLNGSELHAINVGDSGFVHFRQLTDAMEDGNCTDKWRAIYKSPHQSHSFNCPYQLGFRNGDTPEQGEMIKRHVLEDDLIVLGTDGLFDNLFPEQIATLLDTLLPSPSECDATTMSEVARCIAHTAQRFAKDTRSPTPFAKAARSAGHEYDGGKMDDITVVASLVARN